MSKFISHRGNLSGPDKSLENNPIHIAKLKGLDYHIEIDLWVVNNQLFLGHDEPEYKISEDFLKYKNFWIHCKNLEALDWCQGELFLPNYFWHENDRYCLTSHKYIWTYPGNPEPKYGAIVDLGRDWKEKGYKGFVCSDYE